MQKIDFKQLLRKGGLKATPLRLKVLQVLQKTAEPLSIQDVLKKIGEATDQVTLYRMLHSFQRLGAVRKIDLQQNRSYYEWRTPQDHHHLVCTECGKVEDIEGCSVEGMIKDVLRRSKEFSRIDEHSFELFGVCQVCSRGKK